jgi:hypothetical protein
VSRSRTRLVGLLGAALLAITAVAPASAETVITLPTNPYGAYEIDDTNGTPGVRCVYETHETSTSQGDHYLLDKIRVRAPDNFHHYTSNRNWVGWRYILKRDHDYNNSYHEWYRSPIYKARANDNQYPVQFSDRVKSVPESFSSLKGNWKVWIVLFWYKPGSSSNLKTKAVIEYDYYAVKGGGSDTVRMNNCNGANN